MINNVTKRICKNVISEKAIKQQTSYDLYISSNNVMNTQYCMLINEHSILNALLNVHHSTSVQWNQRDAHFIRVLTINVTSITWSSLVGATRAEVGILRACYVSWLHPSARYNSSNRYKRIYEQTRSVLLYSDITLSCVLGHVFSFTQIGRSRVQTFLKTFLPLVFLHSLLPTF
jgi:hypothetical protein